MAAEDNIVPLLGKEMTADSDQREELNPAKLMVKFLVIALHFVKISLHFIKISLLWLTSMVIKSQVFCSF